MANIFFTSDTHFGHRNILSFCNRPFKTLEEHDEGLIENWNKMVKPRDTIFHLGDVSFRLVEQSKDILRRLNGKKVLIYGNHDKYLLKHYEPFFEDIKVYHILKDHRRRFVMMHFPIESWDGKERGAIHLHGHSHGGKSHRVGNTFTLLRFDVGVDCWNYKPVPLDTIVTVANTRMGL